MLDNPSSEQPPFKDSELRIRKLIEYCTRRFNGNLKSKLHDGETT